MTDDADANFYGLDDSPLERRSKVDIDPAEFDAVELEAIDLELMRLPANDLGNAKRLEARFPDHVRWTKEWGPLVWDGRRYDYAHGDAAAGMIGQTVVERLLSHEAPAFWGHARRAGEGPDDFDERARKFQTWCLRGGDNGRTEAMLSQHERRHTLALADFDARPDILVVANGTLDLAAGAAFEPGHSQAHRSTRIATAVYDPDAKCPLFRAFLEQVMPDAEDRAFLARIIGYCLTGHFMEQAYFIFQGEGGDGKSTFLEAIAGALGDYVMNAGIESFLRRDKKGSDHSADMARLASGPRLVKTAEPEEGAPLAEALIKLLTGGEPIPARAMHKEFFEFRPRWKLIISCNRPPKISGSDRGIWRRTMVLPWPVSIPESDFDKTLPDKLRAEASGILNWALEGWADWVERGKLDPSPNSLEAKAQFRLNSDPCAGWYEECVVKAPDDREQATRLYRSYRGWALSMEMDVMKQTAFGRWLRKRRLKSQRSGGMWWLGIKLNPAGEDAVRELEAHEDEERYGARGRGGPGGGEDD